MAESAEAVAAGALDVAQVFEPLASLLEGQGRAHVWHVAAHRGPTAYTTFVTTTERLQARRDEFRAMLRVSAGLAWIAASPAEALAETVAPFFPDLPPALLAPCLARYKALGLWTADPFYPEEAFARLETAMHSADAIRRSPGSAATADDAIVAEALSGP